MDYNEKLQKALNFFKVGHISELPDDSRPKFFQYLEKISKTQNESDKEDLEAIDSEIEKAASEIAKKDESMKQRKKKLVENVVKAVFRNK